MNRIFRSVWNDKTGTFVAASEHANSAGKKSSPAATTAAGAVTGFTRFALKGLALSLMLAFGSNVYALPTGGAVSAGSASIANGAGKTTINQSSQNVAINWQSFNIGQSEAVQFNQPNSSSVALNRVQGADPSSILGSLSANGKVFLVNPNGVLFGKGAQVNVGGLVASTLNISDGDFMAGSYQFSGAGKGTIVNQGSINADGGYVALLGANVSNEGVIAANLGTVALAAGNAMTLDMAGDGLLNVTVDQGAVNALIQNAGLIRANGGQVLLTAQAAGNLLLSAVNNTGVIQAQSIDNHNGTIRLLGDMQSGTVNVGGKLDASAPNGGDGGFVETSAAHVKIADNVVVTTRSAHGKSGTWLIDPVDFTVAAGSDIAGVTLSAQLVTTNITIDSNSGSSGTIGNINVNEPVTWTASGAATTLTLNAFNDVNVNAPLSATTGSLISNAGRDVNLNAATTTITGSIKSTAVRDVNVNAAASTTTGDFIVCCGRDINVNAAITTTTGDVLLRAGRDISINAAMTTTTGNVLLRAGSDGSGLGVAGVGGTVVFAPGSLYTVTSAAPHTVTVDYTPTSYATPHDYSVNFTGTGATLLTQHMLVFAKASDKVYDGNTTATLSFRGNPSLGGVVSLVPGTATFDDKNVAANIGVSYTGSSLGGADAARFALWAACTDVGGTLRTSAAITPRPMSLKADDNTKVYGQTFTPASTAFTVPVPPIAGETVTSVVETTTGTPPTASVAGSPHPIVITPGSATGSFTPANYTITYLNGALTVTPAPLTLKANDNTKVYGQTFTPAATAFTVPVPPQNGETVTGVTETSTGSAPTASVTGGTYPIVITPGSATGTITATNYTITYLNGALAVTPAPLTLRANDNTKVYGQTFTPAATAFTVPVPPQNGETVTGVTETSTGTAPAASVAGSTYPIVITPGSATGTFTASNYTIAYVNGALTVTPAPMTIRANDNTKVYGQTFTPASTAFTTPVALQNGETVGSVTETTTGTPPTSAVPGPYPIIPSNATGGTFTPSNYTITYANGALSVTPAPLTVTASDATKVMGTTPTLTAFSTAGLVNSETVGSVTETSPGTVAIAAPGAYPITPSNPTGGTFTPSNYAVTFVNGALTVTPLPVVPSIPVVAPPGTTPGTPPGTSSVIVQTAPVLGPRGTLPGDIALVVAPQQDVFEPVLIVQAPIAIAPPAGPTSPPTVLTPPVVPVAKPPVVVPRAAPPTPYVPPQRPRKPDRN